MEERSEERKEQYKRIRTEFEDLQIEDKALFLLEATVSTVARGIEQVGKGFANEVDKAFRTASRRKDSEAASEADPAAAGADSSDVADSDGAPAPNVAADDESKPPTTPGSQTDPLP